MGAPQISERPQFPSAPEAAFICGLLFQRLGGRFMIGSNGKRYMTRCFEPESSSVIPQLPGVEPHERLLTHDQWEGAMRIVESCLRSLHPDDKTFLFDALAVCADDPREQFDFREQLK